MRQRARVGAMSSYVRMCFVAGRSGFERWKALPFFPDREEVLPAAPRFDSGDARQGNNFLSGYATPQTINLDVVRTRTPEKLLSEKVSEDVQAWQTERTYGSREQTGANFDTPEARRGNQSSA